MTSNHHKEYGPQAGAGSTQRGKLLLPIIFLTVIAALLFMAGLFFMLDDSGHLDQEKQHNKANLRELAERYNFSGTEAVVDQGIADQRFGGYLAFKNYVEGVTAERDGYRHSIFDIIGSEVVSPLGAEVGFIYDVQVHRWSRKAIALILNAEGAFYTENLAFLRFERVLSQNKDGIAVLKLPESQPSNQPNVHDMKAEKDNWVSLRRLRNGDVLDFEGKPVGKVNAVIYGNAEVQGIYIDLCSALKQYQEKPFFLPFDSLQFAEGDKKRDVVLTKAQTNDLSRCLVPK